MKFPALFRQARSGAAWVLLLPAFAASLRASPPSHSVGLPMPENSPVSIELDFPFSEGAKGGYFPVEAILRNGSGREGTWQLETAVSTSTDRNESIEITTTHRFSVPGGKTARIPLSVALPNADDYDRRSVYLSCTVRGPYASDRTQYSFSLLPYRSRGGNRFAYLLSPGMEKLAGTELRRANSRFGTEHLIAGYAKDRLPTDWRCFVGYDKILMARADWLELTPARRKAVLDAVASGRTSLAFHLPEFSPEVGREPGLREDARLQRHGFGVIGRYDTPLTERFFQSSAREIFRDGTIFDPEVSLPSGPAGPPLPRLRLTADEDERAIPLERRIRERRPPVTLISIGILGFGLLIGPINLFALAAGRKRMRLFITTPLIAIGATGLLVVGIFLADGVGGDGYVSRLIYLKAGANEAYVRQTQYSTSGLLLGNDFKVPGGSLVEYKGASVSNVRNLQVYGSFNVREGVYSGDWFGSKRLQGHEVTTYLPSRESFEEIADSEAAAPVLFSNFRGACETLYYIDSEGAIWKGEGLKLGARQTLERADRSTFADWFAEQKTRAGDLAKGLESGLEPQRAHLYAEVSRWDRKELDLLPSIDWALHSQLLVAEVSVASTKGGR